MATTDPRIGLNSGGSDPAAETNADDSDRVETFSTTAGEPEGSTREEERDSPTTDVVERRALILVPWFPGTMLSYPDLRIGDVKRFLV